MRKNAASVCLSFIPLLAGLITQCDYRGDLVKPEDNPSSYFTLKGQIGEKISSTSFTSSNSPRMALIPINYVVLSPLDTFVQPYESIEFEGEFPFKFTSVFHELPQAAMLHTYTGPSGRNYQIGIYAIGLFDDINRDSSIVMKADRTNTEHGVEFGYAEESDTMIGIVPDKFIVYLEQDDFTVELNAYIAEQIGDNAQWIGLGGGYNLVSSASDTVSKFVGIHKLSSEAEVSIAPYNMIDPFISGEHPPVVTVQYHLFYFQHQYMTGDATTMAKVKINTPSDKIVFVSDYAAENFTITKQMDSFLFKDTPNVVNLLFQFVGLIDLGYAHYSMYDSLKTNRAFTLGNFFTITNAHERDMTRPMWQDTLIVDSDTVHIGYQPDMIRKCGGNPDPVNVESFRLIVQASENAPWTIATTGD
jgi:hypothetical protein